MGSTLDSFKKLGKSLKEDFRHLTGSKERKPIEWITCPVCNNEKITKKAGICWKCRQVIVANIPAQQETINRIMYDISKGYKKLDSYLSRYKIILDIFKELYEYKKYIPQNEFNMDPETYEECENLYHQRISEMIIQKKEMILYKFRETGEVEFLKELKKFRNELLEMQVVYPEFKHLLFTNDIQEVLDENRA